VSIEEARHEYGITPIAAPISGTYDAILLAVAHKQFKEMGDEYIRSLGKIDCVLYDLKYIIHPKKSDLRL